jgi:hypothetical protein
MKRAMVFLVLFVGCVTPSRLPCDRLPCPVEVDCDAIEWHLVEIKCSPLVTTPRGKRFAEVCRAHQDERVRMPQECLMAAKTCDEALKC